MKTMTKNISTQLIMLAFVLGVLSTADAQAGDGTSGLYISIGSAGGSSSASTSGYDTHRLIPAGWQIDKKFLRRKGPGDLLKVTATKARWNGQNYVAYLLVEWGNLEGVATAGPSNWDGSVKVDDGTAYVVKTIGFEQPMRAGWQGGLQLTPKQANKLAKLRQELDEELAEAKVKYQQDLADAYDEIRKPAKLARKLDKLAQKYNKDVDEAQEEYQEDVAELLAKAKASNFTPGDKLIATDDEEEVKWQANVNGGTDSVLIKLVMEDDDEDVVVKAGRLKIKFETTPQRVASAIVTTRRAAVTTRVTIVRSGTYLHHTPPSSGAHSGRYLHRKPSTSRELRPRATPQQHRVYLRPHYYQPRRDSRQHRPPDPAPTTVRRQVTHGRSRGYTRPGRGHTGSYSGGHGGRDHRGADARRISRRR